MSESFSSLVFQSALSLVAILFGVFGFLYSVFAMYSSMADEKNPVPAPICETLIWLCRLMAVLIGVGSMLVGYSLYYLTPRHTLDIVAASGLGLLVSSITLISAHIARKMR